MPTRKQRRRQQKSRRHEYEYVYVDEEGREVAVDPAELKTAKNGRSDTRDRRPDSTGRARPARRPTRTVEPPSWRRVFRRTVVIAPVVIIGLLLLNRNMPVAERILPALFLLVFFVPFSYFTDSLVYRMYRKRLERTEGTRGTKT